MGKKMLWGKNEKINIIRKKMKKKGIKKKKQKIGKKHYVWGATMLSPHHLQSILLKK